MNTVDKSFQKKKKRSIENKIKSNEIKSFKNEIF